MPTPSTTSATATPATGRVAVVGDVGGHVLQLVGLLTGLGVTFDLPATAPTGHDWAHVDYAWPDDLHVISVGDLVHRGPDSLGVLMLVDRLLAAGVWTQVVGNHEQVYVDRPVFEWPEVIDADGSALLREWWADGRMVAATAVHATAGDHLVTHAGLTRGFWDRALGSPAHVDRAVEEIRDSVFAGDFWMPGAMLGYQPNGCAGPVWAEAASELVASWALAPTPAPFHQVHGHTSFFDWHRKTFWHNLDQAVNAMPHVDLRLDLRRRHGIATIRGMRLTGVDPGHGVNPAPVFEPLILTGTVYAT